MRLCWRSTNRQNQITIVDDESTSSTSSLERKERKKHRKKQQHPEPPCDASSSSSPCILATDSSSSSVRNDLSPLGAGDEDNDDSSSSSLPPQQQQHSQAFLTTISSPEDMVISAGICDIEGDPPYEKDKNNSRGCNSNSGGKGRSGSSSSSSRKSKKIQRQQHRRKHHRISSPSSTVKVEDEDDGDEEGSENDIQSSDFKEPQSQSQQQQRQQRRHQQQRIQGQQPPYDSLLHEQLMSQYEYKSHNNRSQSDNRTGNIHPSDGRHGRTKQPKEPVDDDEYEEEKQRQQQTGKNPSKKGSNDRNKDDDNDTNTNNDRKFPNDDDGGTDVEYEEDDDDDGSDHEVPILWKPQDTQSLCEFTHTIRDYSAKRDSGCKKAEYSTTTVDNLGNKWRLIVYVNGNGRASNNHLSLFLQVADADDLPFGWKKAVSYVLTLEHPQEGAGLSYAKRNPDKTFKLCPKAIDWGWSQFITSDRIQQESFVSNDTLVVRASVTVKSSSVDIDIDDAELYLKCAVEEGRPDAVQLCLDQGASINCQFKDDLYTPLHTACSTSPNEDGPNAALGSGGGGGGGEHTKPNTPQSNKNNNNNTNVMATHEGSMKVLELLLEKGADGNACNKWRETPLLIAANNGHKAAVESLLKHGADPSLCSEAGWSALTFAAHKGYGDIVELLLDDGAPVNCRVTEDSSTPLHKACAGSKPGHLEAVKLLLDILADVHALNKWRETPLLTAANHGQAGAVEQLLLAGADPCKCTDTGWSPLSIAAYKGHDDVVKLLLEEGAPTEEADPTLSALLQAATKGLPDTVELLLRHGADHTVTTKKGDTALSILVEQNLIDAAVEMVTEYKASIPRCSRDRKKVQRARLLINLRVKQQQRENGSSDDEGESTLALGNETTNFNSKKKKRRKKNSAEQEAKAAEEALLLELEQEDAERYKQEQDATKKSAKKRKKKEKERQVKKMQEEKRIAEDMEEEEKRRKEEEAKDAMEKEEQQRLAILRKKEEEETRRKQEKAIRQQQQKEQMQRKKLRKEEAERKKALQQKEAEKSKNGNGKNGQRSTVQNSINRSSLKQTESQKHITRSIPTNQIHAGLSKNGAPANINASKSGNNRGWESLPARKPVSESSKTKSAVNGSRQKALTSSKPATANVSVEASSNPAMNQEPLALSSRNSNEYTMSASQVEFDSAVTNSINQQHASSMESSSSTTISSGDYGLSTIPQNVVPNPIHIAAVRIEPPAVSVFRRDKVSELLNRCSAAKATTTNPLGSVDSMVVKKVLFRWIMRAAHDSSGYVDFIIPSWDDFDKLITFFQRQFISETRKCVTPTRSAISMEILKDAGTVVAHLCHSLAKDVADYHRRVVEQLPPDWNDASIGVTVSGLPSNLDSSTVVINWANQFQVNLPASSFMRSKRRFKGATSQLLSSIFVCKTCYDTKLLLTEDTTMDYSLTSNTRSNLSSELSVAAEAWTDPFSALSSSFWGQFAEIDRMFGGLEPFGSSEIKDDLLCKHGGSVSVLVPPDNMLASKYLNRIIYILDSCEQANLPVSFAVFIRSDCLVNQRSPPCTDDLYVLEPRLRDRINYISRVEVLAKGTHYYFSEKLDGPEASATTSIFVLMQNSSGKDRFPLRNVGMLEIMGTIETEIKRVDESSLIIGSALTYAPEMIQRKDANSYISQTAHFLQPSTNLPASPVHPQSINSTEFDFASIGRSGPTLPSSFGALDSSSGVRRAGARRGRLFDLVDNGEEDTMNDVDVVSGMLGTLNVDLFQNGGVQDVDIEAISLMGIVESPVPTVFHPRSNRTQGRFG